MNPSKTGIALLLVSFGTACGGATGDAISTFDDGSSLPPSTKLPALELQPSSDDGDQAAGDAGKKPGDGGMGLDGGAVKDGGDSGLDAGLDAGGYLSPLAVNLGTAGNYVILAKSGISTVPASVITGDLGVSPAAASYITGFSLIADSTNHFSTSTQVTGKVYAADYASPTPANLTTAIGDMQTAFTDAAGRAADVTGLGAGDISGMTIKRGVYKWSTGLMITKDVTLTGSATDVWIFEVAQDLTMASATKITLAGGAVPKNVFWQFSGAATLDTTAHMEGIILCQTAIALKTGASIKGRLLAQTAVTIDTSTITMP